MYIPPEIFNIIKQLLKIVHSRARQFQIYNPIKLIVFEQTKYE